MIPRSLGLVALAASAAWGAIDPGLLNLVMPDAKILTGIQVSQALTSPFGRYVLSQMQPSDAGFLEFITATGFDPTRDLTQILAATGNSANDVLILGRGTFLPAQIATAATAHGGTITPYSGFNIVSGPGNDNGALVFLDNTTAVIGSLAVVEAAIDRSKAQATYGGALAQSAQTASAANTAWFTTQTPLSSFLNGKVPGNAGAATQMNLLQAVIAASGGVTFGATAVTVTADAVTTSNQNAQALVDVLKFLVSMVQTSAPDQAVTTLANSATFTANGATTHMSLSLSEQLAEQLFMTPTAPKARPAVKKPVR